MVKCSKAAKARIKRMSAAERKAVDKAAKLLADTECISYGRYLSISRATAFSRSLR